MTTGRSGREFLRLGALVALLGIAFVTLLVDTTLASARPGVEPITSIADLALPDDRQATAAAPARPGAAVAAAAPIALDGMRRRVARLGIELPLSHGDTVRDTVLRSTPSGAAFLLP